MSTEPAARGDGDGAEEFDVEAALENVTEDGTLSPLEKETAIHFSKNNDDATIYTAEAGLMRRFLAHPAASTVALTVRDGDARPAISPSNYDGGEIVGVEATLPVGGLTVPLQPRKSGQHAEVVTDRVFDRFRGGSE